MVIVGMIYYCFTNITAFTWFPSTFPAGDEIEGCWVDAGRKALSVFRNHQDVFKKIPNMRKIHEPYWICI